MTQLEFQEKLMGEGSFFSRYKNILLASPLLLLPVWEYWASRDVAGFVTDSGVVVGHVEVRPLTAFPMYRSVIQYRGAGGRDAQFVDEVSTRPAEPLGKKVSILVEPRTRATAYRGGLSGNWFRLGIDTTLVLTIFGMVVLITWFVRRDATRRLLRRKQKSRPPHRTFNA